METGEKMSGYFDKTGGECQGGKKKLTEEKRYIELGFANRWKKMPEVVRLCRQAGHRTRETASSLTGAENAVICDLCHYRYFYDSSD